MKKSALVTIFALVLITLTRCQCTQKPATNTTDTLDSLPFDTIVDSTLWGHMGEGTAMSVVEFITEAGDTLYLPKTNEQTGEDADMMGDIRNYSDRFAITIKGSLEDEFTSIATCINVSEMMGPWRSGTNTLTLYVDGHADQKGGEYNGWKIRNGHLVLTGKVNTEYGATERSDTMTILYLDEDSLHLLTPQHETLKYGR